MNNIPTYIMIFHVKFYLFAKSVAPEAFKLNQCLKVSLFIISGLLIRYQSGFAFKTYLSNWRQRIILDQVSEYNMEKKLLEHTHLITLKHGFNQVTVKLMEVVHLKFGATTMLQWIKNDAENLILRVCWILCALGRSYLTNRQTHSIVSSPNCNWLLTSKQDFKTWL